MSKSVDTTLELPDTGLTVRRALETERRKLHAWAAGLVKEVEGRRDEALRRIDLSESALVEDAKIVVKAAPSRSRRPGSKRGPSAAVLAERRREAILRFLVERGRAMRFSEIRTALRLSEFSTRSALKCLIEEGKVVRTGTRGTTRYAARSEGAGTVATLPERGPDDGGTMQGRLMELIADRGSASAEELAQALRVPREEIQAACGGLIREEEIRMASRGGRPVYVAGLAAA
ncbi:MAG TPA: FaeA/PapI family transcriptional regulator [Solirubrobacterales bacterium]|nr:FaeA/PapI family transcriptional regulator [Solirubrobacterales bacterium]